MRIIERIAPGIPERSVDGIIRPCNPAPRPDNAVRLNPSDSAYERCILQQRSTTFDCGGRGFAVSIDAQRCIGGRYRVWLPDRGARLLVQTLAEQGPDLHDVRHGRSASIFAAEVAAIGTGSGTGPAVAPRMTHVELVRHPLAVEQAGVAQISVHRAELASTQ
jgi:hypothetical protein